MKCTKRSIPVVWWPLSSDVNFSAMPDLVGIKGRVTVCLTVARMALYFAGAECLLAFGAVAHFARPETICKARFGR